MDEYFTYEDEQTVNVVNSGSSPESSTLPTLPLIQSGRNAPRSRNGCWTCRVKKVKCDEERPQCRRCLRLRLLCDYKPRRTFKKQNGNRRWATDTVVSNAVPLATDWLLSLRELDESRSLSALSITAPDTAASSVVFTAADHEFVRYFRTSFARLHHTKNPDFSLFSLMFRIAQADAIVMHMVLALGGREIEFRRNKQSQDSQGARSPLWHYSKALKLMAEVIGEQSGERLDLDSVHTALYLMLLYEQKYGDSKCVGLTNHLIGASLILKHQCGESLPLRLLPTETSSNALMWSQDEPSPSSSKPISIYSARLMLWMSIFDSAAASCGVGGNLNAELSRLLGQDNGDGLVSPFQPLEDYERLHRFSNPLYRTTWGESYPQSELLDDVENRNVYFLQGACNQLRFMVAELDKLYDSDESQAKQRAASVEMSIHYVGNKYAELMEVAAELSVATDNSHRLVDNIRAIVPHFYAIILDFLRLAKCGQDLTLSTRQRHALRQIMNLAFQAHKHGGDEAIMRIAWPLYMVALETDDLLHREWVLERMSSIRKFGNNFERAHAFLVEVVDVQDRSGKRVDVRERIRSSDVGLFVI